MRKNNKASKKKTKVIDLTNDQLEPRGIASRNKLKARSENQQKTIDTIANNSVNFISGPAGSGKTLLAIGSAIEALLDNKVNRIILTRPILEAGEKMGFIPGPQPLDSKIVTPDGFKLMKDIKVGDFVISRDGKPTLVTNIYPKGKKDVYRITTSDGRSTECCIDHLWHTQTWEEHKRGKAGSVKTTKDIIETLKTKKNKLNHYLPNYEAVEYNKQDLPLSPYVLGALIGDGSLSNSIGFSSVDKEIIDKINTELKTLGCYTTHTKGTIGYNIRADLCNNKVAKQVKITNLENNKNTLYQSIGIAAKQLNTTQNLLASRCRRRCEIDGSRYEFLPKAKNLYFSNPVKNILENLGLLHKKAWDKFIPEIYKKSSVEDRLELLRGLMDTDGTIKKTTGEYSFCTTSKRLAEDVIEIVRSLGGKATIRSRNRIGKKTTIQNRTVTTRRVSYEFNISLPSGMNPFYLSRKANRVKASYACREKVRILSVAKIGKKPVQCIRVENPEHLYLTDDFIVTHNSAEEKIHPYLLPILDEISHFIPMSEYSKLKEHKKIEIVPLGHMRGRNFHNCFIVADECQNASYDQLKMLLTRIGCNSKMVITGDTAQSDLPYHVRGGFKHMIDSLYGIDGIGVALLENTDIVRNPIISKILDRLEMLEEKNNEGKKQ